MTSDPPPSSSDGPSVPPPPRLSDPWSKDSTELDLWTFDDDLGLDHEMPGSTDGLRTPGAIPVPRERRLAKTPGQDNPPQASGNDLQTAKATKSAPANAKPETASIGNDFADLDQQDEVLGHPEFNALPLPPAPESPPRAAQPVETKADEPALTEANDDGLSPKERSDGVALSLRPQMGLSVVERIGMIILAILLVSGAVATLIFSITRLPVEATRTKTNDFPIKGTLIEVGSAVSYWRAPITDGASPEIVRRGTKLLPVLELNIREGSGAIRVLFRDEERTVVGDAVTQPVRGAGTVIIAATAGFDNVGMHAAYRTGESKPWTIEIFEAPSETTPGADFKKLFDMNLSTDLR